jgi:hypothetical protein
MPKSLAFATVSNPARHAAASLCDVPRRVPVGRHLSGILPSHPKGALHPQKGSGNSGKCGTPPDADSTDVSAGLSPAVGN